MKRLQLTASTNFVPSFVMQVLSRIISTLDADSLYVLPSLLTATPTYNENEQSEFKRFCIYIFTTTICTMRRNTEKFYMTSSKKQ